MTRTNNLAWAEIEMRAAEMVQKSGTSLSHAQAVRKLLETPEGARLYEQGGGARGLGYDPSLPAVFPGQPEPVAKRAYDAIIEPIAKAARTRATSGRGMSYEKAYAEEILKNPKLYAAWRAEHFRG